MICQDCKNDYHEGCKGATWCPCQHRGHQCSRECNHDAEIRRLDQKEAEAVYAQLMGGPVIEAKKAGVNFILQVPEGRDPDEFRKEVEAAMEMGLE